VFQLSNFALVWSLFFCLWQVRTIIEALGVLQDTSTFNIEELHQSSISAVALAYLLQFLKNVQIPSTMFVQASLRISSFLYSISLTSITLFYSILFSESLHVSV